MIFPKRYLSNPFQEEEKVESKQHSNTLLINLRKKSRSLNQNNKRPSQGQRGNNISKFTYDLSILPVELCPIFPDLFSTKTSFSDYFRTFVTCSDAEFLSHLVKGLNVILSDSFPPINDLIDQKVHLKLMQLVESPQMTKDCLECFINISSFYDSTVFIEAGLVETLLELQNSGLEIWNLAIWVLGNFVGESFECRSSCLSKGVLAKVLPFIHVSECQENAIWVVSNFCKGKSQLSEDAQVWVIQEIMKVIQSSHPDVQNQALEAIYYSTLNKEKVLIDNKCLKIIIQLAEYCKTPGLKALRIIGNLVITTNVFHSELIENDLFSIIEGFLKLGDFEGKKEALMILSNLCVDIGENLSSLLCHEVFKVSLDFLLSPMDELKCEAVWIARNLAKHEKSREKITFLGYDEVIISLLKVDKKLILHPVLEFLFICLEFEDFSLLFKSLNGTSLLWSLSTSSNYEIRMRALLLANHYFSNDTSLV